MKKVMFMAAACSVMAMLALSCVKENTATITPDNNQPEQPQTEVKMVDMSITAGVEDPAETKVFSSGNTFKWNGSADHLAVFADVSGNSVMYDFQKEAGSSATSTTFSGSVAEGATLRYASYPYSLNRTRSGDVLGLMLANHQGCDQTNSVPHNTPLYGIISGGTATMKTPCAFLKITVPKTTTDQTLVVFDSLRVFAANCAGNFTVDLSTPATPVVSAGDDDHIAVAPRKSNSSTVYVPILPGTYDDITIRLEYNDGHSNFSKQSTQTQTFQSGYVYDCGEFAGPYVESVITGDGSSVETTLSMAGSAVLWKYAGVTNSDYTFKFFYAAHGTAKGDPGWTEVAASSVSGDGTAATFSASATVAEGAYDFYAQVSDGSVTIDGDIEEAVAKVVTAVEWNFPSLVNGTFSGTWVYSGNRSGKDNGHIKITNSEGNDIFPQGKIINNANAIYYRVWDGSSFGSTTSFTNQSKLPGNMLGATLTRNVDGQDYVLTFPKLTKNTNYYTVWSNLLVSTEKYSLKMECPEGFKIKKVVLSAPTDKTCNYGIATTSGGGTADAPTYVVDSQDYTDGVNTDHEIVIPNAVVGTPYFLVNGNGSSRLTSITVYYEH